MPMNFRTIGATPESYAQNGVTTPLNTPNALQGASGTPAPTSPMSGLGAPALGPSLTAGGQAENQFKQGSTMPQEQDQAQVGAQNNAANQLRTAVDTGTPSGFMPSNPSFYGR